jgi:hypothetical protein
MHTTTTIDCRELQTVRPAVQPSRRSPFGWLARRLARRKQRAERGDLFKFEVDGEVRYIDAAQTWGRLQRNEQWQDGVRVIAAGQVDGGERLLVMEKVATFARNLFQVPDVHTGPDGKPRGLTDCQACDLLTAFIHHFCATHHGEKH